MFSAKSNYRNEQKLVNKLFDNQSTYWKEIYQKQDLMGIIHQQRRTIALNYVDGLSLTKMTRVLEIGCGAGFMAIALAEKGFLVEATDNVPAMIRLTQQNAVQNGLSNMIHTTIENVHDLSFQDGSFNLIVALGVTPWLHDLRKALFEISRVLVPGGFIVLNADNRYRLNHLLDPLLTPALESARMMFKRELKKAGLFNERNVAAPHMYSIKKFNSYLRDVNLTNFKNTNLGFGPFTVLGHRIFADQLGVRIHQKLQKYSDNGFPILRSTGSQYIVLARKND